jgi:ubiquinone/menaquinone biosynthesis C-methylase UbiE
MEESHDELVAASMDAHVNIAKFLPELVADMWALGSTPHVVVDLLRPLGLQPDGRGLIDLGCGKGALGITVAKELGIRTLGVDLSEEFLAEAKKKAAEYDVEGLCEFEQRDLREVLREDGDFDVATLVSLGGVLGRFDQCVAGMRRAVKPGGFLIIDDGFLTHKESVARPGYGHYQTHERTLDYLSAYGDTLVDERLYTQEETRAINDEYLRCIRGRIPALVRRFPEAEAALKRYVATQESECEFIDREITGAIWLLRRA